jgi:nucleotide-binding universal stress UspA family protein
MSDPASAPVVVGVDDSRLGLAAVRLAAREAALHSSPLRIVHSFNWTPEPGVFPETELRDPAERVIANAIAAARETEPGIEISSALIEGPALTTLLRESGSAALTVIGDGGLVNYDGVPAETLAVQIAARAGSTVLVARENPPPPGPILVGVDNSPSSDPTLEFAFDAAARRGVELIIARVLDPLERPDPPKVAAETAATATTTTEPAVETETETEAEVVEADAVAAAGEQLAEAVAPWQQKYPAVQVSQRVCTGDPKTALIEESRRARLAVVSARGDQPWRGMLGAVSQALLYHSPAPVAVVRSSHGLYIQE